MSVLPLYYVYFT